MTRKLNIRFLLTLTACCVVAAGSLWLLYRFQVHRVTHVLLQRAEDAENEGQLDRATTYVTRYLRCKPDDHDVLSWYADLLEKQARSREARIQVLMVLDRLLVTQAHRDDIRKKLVRLAMETGQFQAAATHLRILLKSDPSNSVLENQLAQCESANRHQADAIVWYEKAIADGPQSIETYLQLTELMQSQSAPDEDVRKVLNALVVAHGTSFRAYLARARYFQAQNALPEASADLVKAKNLAPREFDVLMTGAEIAIAQRQRDEAKTALQECLKIQPAKARLYGLLALLQTQVADRGGAIDVLRQGLRASPADEHAVLLPLLTDLLLQEGKAEEAAAALAALRKTKSPGAGADFLDARLLMQRRQWNEAAALLRDLPDSLHGPERALALHLQKAADEPKDYRNHLALGVNLWTSKGASPEVDATLLRAVLTGDFAADALETYVQYLILTGNKARANEFLEQAVAKLSPERAVQVLPQCYEFVGRLDQAQAQYETALTLKVETSAVFRAGADYYLRRNDFARAEPHLRAVLEPRVKAPETDLLWARRNLAIGLALSGQADKLKEASELLKQNANQSSRTSSEDKHARAIVLAKQSNSRAEAIGLFEDLLERESLSAEELFILVQLHDADRDWARERKRLATLLAMPQGKTPSMLAYAVQVLAKHGELAQAQELLNELQAKEPDTLRTVALRAFLCKAAGKEGDAVELLQTFAQRKETDLGLVASVLEDLGQIPAADAMFARYATEVKRPEAFVARARFLGRQKRFADALEACDQAAKDWPIERVVGDYVALLHLTQPTSPHFQRVERRLQGALDTNVKSVPLLLAVAQIRDMQERRAEAMALYRRVLALDSENAAALNNLAWLLALDEDQAEEALKLINRALARHGPAPQLLDTRAVIYLARREARLALLDLQRASTAAPTPAHYFHMARAYMLTEQRKDAHAALQKARDLRLTPGSLHVSERALYTQMLSEFAQ